MIGRICCRPLVFVLANESLSCHTSALRPTSLAVSNKIYMLIPLRSTSNYSCQDIILPATRSHRQSSRGTPILVPYLARSSIRTKSARMAQIISGKATSDEIRASLKAQVDGMSVKPTLAIVQVGGREDSNVYIRMKIQFAESIGAEARLIKLSREASEAELTNTVQQLNRDASIHGIITQLPFDTTSDIDSDKIVNLIHPSKDVDGLSIYNAGKLLHGDLDSFSFIPCTPKGCMELIKKAGVKLEGSRSVVIGRSKIVGSPMAQLLVWSNSTVTICHSKTKNLDEICRQADIIVAAVGRPKMVKKSWLKPGVVIIDCGINVIPDPTKKSGTRLVGDVDFEECCEVAGAITPVPGGVGPMTVAMLIANTVQASCRTSSTN